MVNIELSFMSKVICLLVQMANTVMVWHGKEPKVDSLLLLPLIVPTLLAMFAGAGSGRRVPGHCSWSLFIPHTQCGLLLRSTLHSFCPDERQPLVHV